MRKAFKDAEFHREYQKAHRRRPRFAMPEEMEKAIREMPRDAEVTDLLKKLSAEARFPRDNCKENPDSGLPLDP
jgi:hypothetical protein